MEAGRRLFEAQALEERLEASTLSVERLEKETADSGRSLAESRARLDADSHAARNAHARKKRAGARVRTAVRTALRLRIAPFGGARRWVAREESAGARRSAERQPHNGRRMGRVGQSGCARAFRTGRRLRFPAASGGCARLGGGGGPRRRPRLDPADAGACGGLLPADAHARAGLCGQCADADLRGARPAGPFGEVSPPLSASPSAPRED